MYNDFVVYVSAGGQSTRLYPLTIELTKAWLDVGNKTPLLLALRSLASRVPNLEIYILTQGFNNNIFIPTELRDGQPIGNDARVKYVHFYDPRKPPEKRVENKSGEGFIIFLEKYSKEIGDRLILTMNVDNLATFDPIDMAKFHKNVHSGIYGVTIGVTRWDDSATISQFGTVNFDPDSGKISEFREKSPEPASNYINTGIVMFSPKIIDLLRRKSLELLDLGGSVIPYLLNNGASVFAYGHEQTDFSRISDWV
ncbi:MAG: sugar phosphate nucleotidyltransferase, partial [Candidatus Anstonellales archaeon]